MVEYDPMPDVIAKIARTMEPATVMAGSEVQSSDAVRMRKPTDVIQPDGFPRPWLDRSFGGINSYFVEQFGHDKSPLETAVSRLRRLGSVTLLDVGCGTGNTLRTWADAVRRHAAKPDDVTAIGINLHDYSKESISARTRHAIQRGDVEYLVADAQERLEIPDGSVDTVLAFMSLVHMRRPLRAIRHAERTVRPGGVLFFQVTNDMMLSSSPLARQIDIWCDTGYTVKNTLYNESDVLYVRVEKPEAS